MIKFILCIILFTITIQAQTIDEAKKLFDETQQHKEAIEIFQKFPNDGEALYYLGRAYLYGMGVEKNEHKALSCANQSALKNNAKGINLLGVLYKDGIGTNQDKITAPVKFKEAAELDNTDAMINIARMYAVGDFVIQDANQAIYWVKQALENGDVKAIKLLGDLYASSEVKNYQEAIKNYNNYLNHKEADQVEIPYVYLRIGDIYKDLGDNKKSFYYYEKSAQLDNIDAIMEVIYLKNPYDFMSEKDYLMWMKKGVEHKDKLAYDPLYMYYLEKNDNANLKSFLEKAYYDDHQLHMGCNLGSYYLNISMEHHDDIDYKKAYDILNEIIEKNPKNNGIHTCYSNLSLMYKKGDFVTKNFEKAIEFEKKSFEISSDFTKDEIAESIAEQYLKELQDYENAQKWYQIAYDLTKDEKYLSMVDEYKKSLPVYEPLPQKKLQEIFPVLSAFIKPQQVVSYIESRKYFFLATDDKSIKIYDKENLQLVKELRAWIDHGIAGVFFQMAYDENNQLLYASTMDSDKDLSKNDTIKVFDIHAGKVIKIINNKKAMKNTYLTISDDGQYLAAINNEQLLNIIDTKNNVTQHYNLNSQGKFTKAKIEKKDDDYLIYLLSMDNQLYTFSIIEKKRIKKEAYVGQVLFRTFNGKQAEKIFGNIELFDLKNISFMKKNINIENLNNSFYSFDIKNLILKQENNIPVQPSQTNRIKIISKYDNRLLEVYDENHKLLSEISLLYENALKYEVLDNKYILVVTSDISQMLVFALDGRPLASLQGIKALQTNTSYQNGLLVTFGSDNVINIFDLKNLDKYSKKKKKYNQETMQNFLKLLGLPVDFLDKIDDGIVSYMVQTKQFNFGFTPTVKQVKDYFDIFMLEKEEVKSRASLYIKNDKDWILYTPEGLFTYGGEGYKLLKYHQNQGFHKEARIIENEKLFDKFYRPDLIKKILADEKIDIPMDVKAVILNIKPPELQILSNQMINEKDINLIYKICDAGDGIADPKLIINGQAINPPSSRGFTIQKIETKEDRCNVYRSTHTLSPGENSISFKAYDKDKLIASESAVIKVMADYKMEEKPNLYFLSIAVSDYKDNGFDLKYPVSDAIKVKEKMQQKSKSVYENIYTYELHEKDVNLKNINKTFDEIKSKISKNDVFILYIAGHGISKDSVYHFIPYDQAERISIHELKINLSKLENDKSLILLDTCQSGAAIDSIVDEIATVNRLSYDDNRNYIVASSKNQVALEGYKDHGVFTYGVLDAFINNDKLKVWGLADHISEIVPKITQEKFHFSQKPQAKLNQNFILIGGKN